MRHAVKEPDSTEATGVRSAAPAISLEWPMNAGNPGANQVAGLTQMPKCADPKVSGHAKRVDSGRRYSGDDSPGRVPAIPCRFL
jgi:hypothetical protein